MAELAVDPHCDVSGDAQALALAARSVAEFDVLEAVAECMEHAAQIGDGYFMSWMLTNPDWAVEVHDDMADNGSVTGRRMVAAKTRMGGCTV